jgi:hypothetical protein
MKRALLPFLALVMAGVANPVSGLCYDDAQVVSKKVFVQRLSPTALRVVVEGVLANKGDRDARCIVVGGLCANYLDEKRWENLGGKSYLPVFASRSESTFRIPRLRPGGKKSFRISCEMLVPRHLKIKKPEEVQLQVNTMVEDDCPWLSADPKWWLREDKYKAPPLPSR